MRKVISIILIISIFLCGFFQLIDLGTQVKGQLDLTTHAKGILPFSNLPTPPYGTQGIFASIPATCYISQLYFATDKPIGQNLYGCTSTNIWNQLGGSGGGSGLSLVTTTGSSPTGINYTGTVSSFGGYAQDLTLLWDIGSTACIPGPITLAINGLAAKSIKEMDGITDPVVTDCAARQILIIAYDFNGLFRIIGGILGSTVIAAGPGNASSIDPSTNIQTISTDPTMTPRFFSGSGAPGISCTSARDLYTDTSAQQLYSCTATNTWKASGSSTDRQSFIIGYGSPGSTYASILDSNGAPFLQALTGPNSLPYHNAIVILSVSDWLSVAKKASSTWSGAAGTVDINISESNIDGAPAAGSWNLNFYVGCAATGALFTYGTVNTITVTPGSAGFSNYSAPGVTLPASCAAGRPMQFWLQRVADTGGVTGVRPGISIMEVVIRGN